MQIELIEIRDHLQRFPPFDKLPEETLNEISRQVQVGYFKADSEILAPGAPIHELHYVRSGAVEIHRRSGELHNRLTEGEIFGQAGLMGGNRVRLSVRALEDSLIYFIPGALFHQLCEQFDSFADFVELVGSNAASDPFAPMVSRLIEDAVHDRDRVEFYPLRPAASDHFGASCGARAMSRSVLSTTICWLSAYFSSSSDEKPSMATAPGVPRPEMTVAPRITRRLYRSPRVVPIASGVAALFVAAIDSAAACA